jgi:GT2 family glycosyltransferase
MTITIITVNYNCAEKTIELLRSLERQSITRFDIIVVDNDSTPADRGLLGEYTASSRLHLDIIYSDRNRGFAGGSNLGIRKALAQGSMWLLLINPDTTVGSDFIATLQPQLTGDPAVIGIPLKEDNRVAYAGIVRWLAPTLPHLYRPPASSDRLLYVIGAGLAIHRDAFEHIGFLDERYFLYFEDADFSMRVHRAGIPIRFLTSPVIEHGVSQSTRKLGGPLLLRYHARNALLFNSMYGPRWIRAALPLAALYGMIFQLAKIVLMPSRRVPSKAIAAGIIDFYAHRFGKISTPTH